MAPQPKALILHTDLEPAFLDRLKTDLERAEFQPAFLTPKQRTLLLEQWAQGKFTLLEKLLPTCPLLILDEQIAGHSAFEFLILINALRAERPGQGEEQRLCLLCTNPSGGTAFAAWNEGVHLLVDKASKEEAYLNQALRRLRRSARQAGRGFSARAKWASNTVLALNVQRGKTEIEPDDLALVLLKDQEQASYKALLRLGVDVEATRQELLRRLGLPTVTPQPLQDFLDAATRAKKTAHYHHLEKLTYVEAWQSRTRLLSTGHLLLGIVRSEKNLASQILAEQGVDLEALRSVVLPLAAEEDADSDAYYAREEEQFAPLWKQTWSRVGEYLRLG